jgi:hypothetical protein
MNHVALIEQYLAGPGLLQRAVDGMPGEQLLAKPIPGKWSTKEVVCHLADYEPIYADRMKRVIALKEPELLKGDPGLFAACLAYVKKGSGFSSRHHWRSEMPNPITQQSDLTPIRHLFPLCQTYAAADKIPIPPGVLQWPRIG